MNDWLKFNKYSVYLADVEATVTCFLSYMTFCLRLAILLERVVVSINNILKGDDHMFPWRFFEIYMKLVPNLVQANTTVAQHYILVYGYL